MSQSKITPGSPKSPKSPDDHSKSDGASLSSPPKSGCSPSSAKSSPGNAKPFSLAERLAQSTNRGKSSPTPRSPVSKSPPISPNSLSKYFMNLSYILYYTFLVKRYITVFTIYTYLFNNFWILSINPTILYGIYFSNFILLYINFNIKQKKKKN